MAPVDTAICHFTGLGGVYGTTLNSVFISKVRDANGQENWWLNAWSDQSGDNFVWAKARCFLRKQPGYTFDGSSPHQICLNGCASQGLRRSLP